MYIIFASASYNPQGVEAIERKDPGLAKVLFPFLFQVSARAAMVVTSNEHLVVSRLYEVNRILWSFQKEVQKQR